MNEKKDDNFQISYDKLKDLKQIIDNKDTPLEQLVEAYESAAECYLNCMNALDSAKQRVEIVKAKVVEVTNREDTQ